MDAVHPTPFGTLLRRYRLAAELTQEQLAERAGVSARRLGDLERGVLRLPRASTLALLAEALGLSPEEARALTTAARLTVPAVRAVPAPDEHALPPFVGRTVEVALLQAHLAGSGPPLLLLAGEPGIGKSRLLRHAHQQAVAAGWRVLSGGCQRRGGQGPYAPLPEALAAALAGQTPAQLRQTLGGCAWLVRLLPELAAGPVEPLPAWIVAPEDERRLIFAAVQRFLSNLAGPAGTLLVLDDLQWTGADALDLIASLVRARGVPVRLVGAYRETEVRPGDPLATVLADLGQAGLVRRRQLQPLAPAEVAALLDALLAGLPGDQQSVATQVAQRSGGVPFFVVSCAQSVQGEPGEASAIPWDVAEGIRQRVALLAPVARQVLGAAAIGVERTAHLSVLAVVLEQSEGEVLGGLEEGRRARLLDDVAGSYCIAHDLIREVLEADLGSAGRMLLHRRMAEVFEEQAARSGSTPGAEVLAYHFTRSDRPDRAVGYLEQAGDQARAQQGRAAAEGYYRETVAWLDRLGRPLEAAPVRESFGTLLRSNAQYGEALAALEPAAATLRAAGDLEATGRVEALIAGVHNDRGLPAEGLARLEPVLALLAVRGPSRALADLYSMQAILLSQLCRLRENLVATEQAERSARLAGTGEQLAEALYLRGLVLTTLGRLPEAVELVLTAIPMAEAASDPWRLGWGLTFLGHAYVEQGSIAAARQATERALPLAERHGFRNMVGFLSNLSGWCAFYTGEWVAARQDFEREVAIARAVADCAGTADAALCLGMLCLAEGAAAEASQHIEECEGLLDVASFPFLRQLCARVIAERDLLAGRPDLAHARLAPLLAPDAPQEEDPTPVVPILVRALLALDRVVEAADLATRAVALARQTGRQVVLADALWVMARVAMRQGRTEEAEAALTEGLSLARQLGYPYGEARLLHVYGELHAQRGQSESVHERLAAALAIFRHLGARRDATHAEQALAALQTRGEAEPHAPVQSAWQTAVDAPSGTRPARADRQAWALERLRTAGPLSPGTYASALGVSVDTALRDLQQLVDQGLVQAAGRTKNRRYTLAGEAARPAIRRTGV